MTQKAFPHLMFEGQAEAAISLYRSVFPDAKVGFIDRWPDGGPGAGAVRLAELTVAGLRIRLADSPMPHAFGFTPSVSLFVELADVAAVDAAAEALAEGGSSLMPPGDYGFSPRFAWVQDRFGVSWQLNAGRAAFG